MTDAIRSVQTPAQRGRFSLCALMLVLVLLGCGSPNGHDGRVAVVRTGTDGTNEGVVTA